MRTGLVGICGVLAAAVIGTSAIGDGHEDKAIAAAVKARQAQMTLYAFNLGALGAMAKGEAEYDAGVAAGASAVSHVNDSGFWMISRYLGMTEKETLKTWTVISTIVSIVGYAIAQVLWYFV